MDIRSVNYFLAIAKHNNISKAANELFVSQSTLSLFLSREEQEIGVQLFLRKKNKLVLTPAGEIYEKHCKEILQAHNDLYSNLSQYKDSKIGHIKVGITPQWGGEMFASIYPIFKQKYPNYSIHLLEDTAIPLQKLIDQDELDFAIVTIPQNSEVKIYKQVCLEELVLAMPVSGSNADSVHLGNVLKKISLSEMKNHNFIISCNGTTIRAITNQLFISNHFKPQIICEINNHSSSLKMVASGLGVTIIPHSYIKEHKSINYYTINDGCYWMIVVVSRKNFQPSEPDLYLLSLIEKYYA